MLQAGTAHGAIIIEDDNDLWLPAENGCSEVADVLSTASDTVLDLQFYFFRKPNPKNGVYTAGRKDLAGQVNVTESELQKVVDVTSDMNNGEYRYISQETNNPLCCGGKGDSNAGEESFEDKKA